MGSTRAAAGWLRRHFTWSNTRRSWYERLGFLALLAGAAGGWWISRDWRLSAQVMLVALWLLLLAVLLRRGIIKLLGPVFFFELLRGSRRRVHLGRVAYALLLFFFVAYTHVVYVELDRHRDTTPQDQAEVAATFFIVFFVIQMVVILFLTPVMVAGAIAEEKERRTLEFILATDLRSREIVLGKLAARMAGLALLLLVGLPVLSLLQFQGGIDPDLLLCALAALVLSLASVATVSVWMSTMLRRGRDAIVLTYLTLVGYLLFSSAAYLLSEFHADFWTNAVQLGGYTITGQDLVDGFGAGNPFAAAGKISFHLGMRSGSISDVILELLRDYATFHGVIIVGGLVWSVVRLRPLALAQGPGGETKRQRRGRRLPALGRRPMFWKEVFAEPGMRLHFVLRVLLVVIVLASFVPPVLITANYLPELLYGRAWSDYREAMSAWVVATGGVLGTVLLLMAAARAAGSITGERARHTLDDLLTSPLTNAEIVNAKWWGALLAQRRGLLWLGIVYCIGLCSGGVSIVGALAYFVALIVYASFMVSIGLFFSANSRGTFRATLKTMIAALFFLGGHWLLSGLFCFLPLAIAHNHTDDLVVWLVPAQVGFTPPAILTMAPLIKPDKIRDTHEHIDRIVGFAVFGLCVFVIAGQLLRNGVIAKFAQVMNRTAVHKADGPLPKEAIPEAVVVPAQPEKIVEPGTVSP